MIATATGKLVIVTAGGIGALLMRMFDRPRGAALAEPSEDDLGGRAA